MAQQAAWPAFEAKMRAAGLSDAAVGAFKANYDQLVAGVTGLVSSTARILTLCVCTLSVRAHPSPHRRTRVSSPCLCQINDDIVRDPPALCHLGALLIVCTQTYTSGGKGPRVYVSGHFR
jgi:hypothetical protein